MSGPQNNPTNPPKPKPSNLKIFRTAMNFTQEELADRANCSRTTIVALEQKKALPTLKTALRIAAALEIDDVSRIFPIYSRAEGS